LAQTVDRGSVHDMEQTCTDNWSTSHIRGQDRRSMEASSIGRELGDAGWTSTATGARENHDGSHPVAVESQTAGGTLRRLEGSCGPKATSAKEHGEGGGSLAEADRVEWLRGMENECVRAEASSADRFEIGVQVDTSVCLLRLEHLG